MQLIGLETPTGGNAGSTVDAMSDAIEGADVMLYGVSLAYKESANVSGLSNLRVSGIVYPVAVRHARTLMLLCFCLHLSVPNGS
eukprot:COSAG06_NODE_7347_length_2536_cov_382.057037_3_plen_84_part_00